MAAVLQNAKPKFVSSYDNPPRTGQGGGSEEPGREQKELLAAYAAECQSALKQAVAKLEALIDSRLPQLELKQNMFFSMNAVSATPLP